MSRLRLRDILDLVSAAGSQAARGRLRVRSGPAGSMLAVRCNTAWVDAASWRPSQRPNHRGLLWCARAALAAGLDFTPRDGTLTPEEHEAWEVMES